VPTEYQEMSDRYVVMSTDDLLRVAADSKSLTMAAREALAEELQKRGLDSPDAIGKYEHERDQQVTQEEEQAAAVRWSKRSRFQRVFDHLKDHPMVALLARASLSQPWRS
jgi:ribonuclease HII